MEWRSVAAYVGSKQSGVPTGLTIVAALLILQACAHDGAEGRGRHRGDRPGDQANAEAHREPPAGLQLKYFDLNGDGQVTRDELDRGLHALFAKYDTDRDGVLSPVETRALNDALPKEIPGSSPVFDWNADGHVDFKEFSNQWISLFDRLDKNGDGVVTEEEMKTREGGPRPAGQPEGSRPSGRRGGGRGGGQPGGS